MAESKLNRHAGYIMGYNVRIGVVGLIKKTSIIKNTYRLIIIH